MCLDGTVDDLSELLFRSREIDFKLQEIFGLASVDKAEILRNRLVEDQPSERRVDDAGMGNPVDHSCDTHLDRRMNAEQTVGIGHHRLVEIAEHASLSRLAVAVDCEIVGAEHHIL